MNHYFVKICIADDLNIYNHRKTYINKHITEKAYVDEPLLCKDLQKCIKPL